MWRIGAVSGVVIISVVACGGGGSGVPKCVPGDAKACVGPSACAGGQVCQGDGTYAACICAAATGAAGSQGGAGATVGAAGAGGASGAGGQSGAAGSSAGASGAGGVAPACNEFDQSGCASSERCTWVSLSKTTGHVACVPNGTVAQWGACTTGAPGEATGFDDCQRGLACYEGLCQPICSVDLNLVCHPEQSCTMTPSLFYSAGSNADYAGVCAPTCNPVSQVRDYDQAPACGSPTPASPTFGCYGNPGQPFTCQDVVYPNNTSDVPAPAPSTPPVNGCAPGYLPLTFGIANRETICAALCQPAPTSSSATTQAGGVSPYTCAAAGAGGTHECRYWWSVENTSAYSFPDAFSNTLGYCIDYTKYIDPYKSSSTALPQPSCTALSTTAHTYDAIVNDAQFWGCQPHPTK
jgi:hypothetical protein